MIRYCHIGSQHGRVPTQVRAWRPRSEGNVGGTWPSQMKVWSSPGRFTCRNLHVYSTRKLQILGECSLLYLRRTGRQFQNDFPKPGCVPLMRWQVSYFGALLPKSWVSLFPAGSLLALSASAFREAARKLVNYFYSESTINKYLQTVCIFDKFHHTFNFKSKVSRDVFNNRNEYQLTSTIFSKLSSQCHMPSCRCHFDF